jgi:hypothetical protein
MMMPTAAGARAAVPWIRIAAGIVSQIAPRSIYPLAAIRAAENADAEFIIRAFGTGAIALGAISAGFAGMPLRARRCGSVP